jgi:Photoprotection regulator fluorescence recovery protein
MHDLKWTDAEKKIARRVFDAALQRELAQTLAAFKVRAADTSSPDTMWPIEDWLRDRRREIDAKYDYRYSQLDLVFGRLLRERRIEEKDLDGLAPDKLDAIRRVAAF